MSKKGKYILLFFQPNEKQILKAVTKGALEGDYCAVHNTT